LFERALDELLRLPLECNLADLLIIILDCPVSALLSKPSVPLHEDISLEF
jgi:hypothetical protein